MESSSLDPFSFPSSDQIGLIPEKSSIAVRSGNALNISASVVQFVMVFPKF